MTDRKDDPYWHEGDRRHSERHRVYFELRVTDRDQDVPIGDVVDISLRGMRIMGETLIPVDTTRRLQLHIVWEEGATTEAVCFEARSLWCQYVEELGLYETGFANSLSPAARVRIEHLMHCLIHTAVYPTHEA